MTAEDRPVHPLCVLDPAGYRYRPTLQSGRHSGFFRL
jgi:hypothetical protein